MWTPRESFTAIVRYFWPKNSYATHFDHNIKQFLEFFFLGNKNEILQKKNSKKNRILLSFIKFHKNKFYYFTKFCQKAVAQVFAFEIFKHYGKTT